MADPATYRPAPGSVPDQPGVYRFSDERGRVIYVGKAKSLRSRLNSYFQDVAALHPRTRTMVLAAAKVDWTVVETEVEALQLEFSWIQEFDPKFNVRYRDDKSYPSLAVTLHEEYPRLQVMRGPKRKGVRYFGPYAHAWAIRETLDLLLRVFPARTCSAGVFKRSGQIGRPCLLGYIGKCSAPCVGRVTAEEHREIVEDFCDFMAGQTTRYLKRLEREMKVASDNQEYERAARLRDDIGALERAVEKNAVVLSDGTDADVVGIAEDSLEAAVQLFHVRGGRVRGQRGWVVDKVEDVSTSELVEHFLVQMYGETGSTPIQGRSGREGKGSGRLAESAEVAIPREVLVPAVPSDAAAVTEWLERMRGGRVEVRVPQRGDKRALMQTVTRNAQQALVLHKTRRASDLTTRSRALEEIQEALELAAAPLRIECFDVSNLQGTEVVASMVVFEDGLARKAEYRRFVIRGLPDGRADDTRSIHEVISRRFRRFIEGQEALGPVEVIDPNVPVETPDVPAGIDPATGPDQEVRVPAEPRGRGRRRPPGRRGPARDGGARHHRRRALRPGQATRGGVAPGRGRPGDLAEDQRGALPAAAGSRRGAPFRDHPPPRTPVEVHDVQRAGRHPRSRRGAPEGAAPPLRLGEAAARGDRRRDRGGRGVRSSDRGDGGDRARRASYGGGRGEHVDRRDPRRGGQMTDAGRPIRRSGQIVVVSGMSGAGRSAAADVLEDLGWFVIDNLPPGVLPSTLAYMRASGGLEDKVAVVVDVRSRSFFADLNGALAQLEADGWHVRVLFLEASDDVLVRRYESVRRPHPLQSGGRVLDGIQRERTLVRDLRGDADLVVDTSTSNIHELRAKIVAAFGGEVDPALRATIVSFGYKYGLPVDADLVDRLPVPAEPALGRRAAPEDRSRRRGPGVRARAGRCRGLRSLVRGVDQHARARVRPRGQAVRHDRRGLHRRQAPQRGDRRRAGHRAGGRRPWHARRPPRPGARVTRGGRRTS